MYTMLYVQWQINCSNKHLGMCQALTIESKEHICVFQLLSENVKKQKMK